jgi:hypothetical protein
MDSTVSSAAVGASSVRRLNLRRGALTLLLGSCLLALAGCADPTEVAAVAHEALVENVPTGDPLDARPCTNSIRNSAAGAGLICRLL